MAVPGKWIKGILPTSCVSDAAKRSLAARLEAVEILLPLAALHPEEDVEHVHRLRVATRRAVAAIDLYKDFLPRKRVRRLKRLLKRIRRAAGVARDMDVLCGRIHQAMGDGMPILASDIARRRAAAQPAIVAVYDLAIKGDRLQRQTTALLNRVRPRRKRDKRPEFATIAEWAQHRLAHIAERFFTSEPNDSHDFAALHRFRVRGKMLRYALELLSSAIPSHYCRDAYPLVEELQDYLGAVNDHVAGAERLDKWFHTATNPHEQSFLARLAEKDRQRLEAERQEFWGWWQAGHRAQLQSALSQCRRDAPPDSHNRVVSLLPSAKAN